MTDSWATSLPSHPRAAGWRAWQALAAGNGMLALSLLKPAVDTRRLDPVEGLALVGAYTQTGDLPRAVAAARQFDALPYLLATGDTALTAGRAEEAIRFLKVAYEVYPDEAAAYLADAMRANGQLEEAESLLKTALLTQPKAPHLYYQLGTIYRTQGRLDEAIATMQQAIALDTEANAGYRLALAIAFDQANRIDEAIAAYQAALDMAPGYNLARIGLAKALYRSGHGLEAAAAELLKAIQFEPESAAGYKELGRIYQAEHRYDEADEWYRQALGKADVDQWVWVMHGENALQAGNLPYAANILEETVTRFPTFAHAYLMLAEVYREAGEVEKSIAAIERCVSLAPNENIWYWVTAGQIYEWADRRQSAVDAYNAALALDPSNQAAQDGVQRLHSQ